MNMILAQLPYNDNDFRIVTRCFRTVQARPLLYLQ